MKKKTEKTTTLAYSNTEYIYFYGYNYDNT